MSGEPKSRRGPLAIAGVALAGAALFGAVLAIRSPESPAAAPKARRAPVEVVRPPRSAPPYVAPPLERPIEAANQERMAKAMDQSGARQLVRALGSAAASGNEAVRAALLDAVVKHPASPKSVLEDELTRPQPAAVRAAFEEALARCR